MRRLSQASARTEKLKRQIDWQALDDEPDVEDSTRTLDDPKYRPDDPPSRTTETWADYLKKGKPATHELPLAARPVKNI